MDLKLAEKTVVESARDEIFSCIVCDDDREFLGFMAVVGDGLVAYGLCEKCLKSVPLGDIFNKVIFDITKKYEQSIRESN